MTRLNLILFFVLIFTALASVTAQHKSRKLYFELQQQQDAAKLYDVEWGQLQLEQSTWAMHARIEYVAEKQLHMEVPDNKRIQVVVPGQPAVLPATAAKPATAAALKPATDKAGSDKPVDKPADKPARADKPAADATETETQ